MYCGKGCSGQSLFVWYAYLKSNGGDLFDKNWKPIFNQPAGIEATGLCRNPGIPLTAPPRSSWG